MAEDYDKLICSAQNAAYDLERQADAAEAKGDCGCEVASELLSSLVFEGFGSCGDLVEFGGFNSVFEGDACDDFGKVVKAA